MADYGHELAFGTFITPRSDRPAEVVALAQRTERAGLDLATFQDHPYQPALLDAWTLLSWVAAKTDTLRISGNVLNLPLRPPAVLARAAASLDLLSGGRFELGLGAGGFWDPIAAMGGRKLTPGQGVDALSEAIDVIRAVWDTSTRRGVNVDGDYYAVKGAKRGPDPAHEIEIWLGALKPRMLRLIGRKADGWLPSLGYLKPEDIAPANRTIDEAAVAAGRDPREIRRLVNLPPDFLEPTTELSVEKILPLVREHGFSTLILWSDDPHEIDRYGQEVAPGVRAAVARERGDSDPSLSVRAVRPRDRDYRRFRSTYVRSGSPRLVLVPGNEDQVVGALAAARDQEGPLAVRSGGHGISGRSTNDGGIVIDLRELDAIELLDESTGRVRVGPGARWGDVARKLAPHGLGMSSGDYGDVGVGGLATAGGIGFLVRKHGLTIDHLVAAELVLADGSRVRAEHGDELLWAVRGAGANFGIVTAFELEAYPVGDVVFSRMTFQASADMLERWGATVEAAPRELTSFLSLVARRGGTPTAQLYSVYAGDDTAAAVEALTPLLEVGPLLDQQAQLLPYPAIVPPHRTVHSGSPISAFRSGLLDHVAPAAAAAIEELLRSGEAPMMQLRSVGGAVNDIAPDATAYAHRTQNFSLNAVGVGVKRLNDRWDPEMAPHLNGLYISFDGDQRPERLLDAYPEPTLTRLRELKARYDPDNLFNQNFPISPASTAPLPS